MKRAIIACLTRTLFGCLFLLSATAGYGAPEAITSHDAKIENVQLHYLTAGHGPAVILLHGCAENSRMWRPIIPLLAEKFTVIAPDLAGIGESSIPTDKIDMLRAANRIHAVARPLLVQNAGARGHASATITRYASA